MLKDKILLAQAGNHKEMLELIEQFMPLIKKYGQKLHTEDGLYDMRADFIELITKVNIANILYDKDPGVIRYLECALRHCYIKRLATIMNCPIHITSLDDLEGTQKDCISQLHVYDSYFATEFLTAANLTAREEVILEMIYNFSF